MTTSEVARRLACSEGSVRSFERRGLLTAERTATGMRLYHAESVERLATERESDASPRT